MSQLAKMNKVNENFRIIQQNIKLHLLLVKK